MNGDGDDSDDDLTWCDFDLIFGECQYLDKYHVWCDLELIFGERKYHDKYYLRCDLLGLVLIECDQQMVVI